MGVAAAMLQSLLHLTSTAGLGLQGDAGSPEATATHAVLATRRAAALYYCLLNLYGEALQKELVTH
jgi:hypothetical protein